jgi:3-methyladenine DNA glycosylase AlkD
MAAYMRGRFAFLGIAAPQRRAAQRAVFAGLATPEPADVLAFADACWEQPEREYQYAGADLVRHHADTLDPAALPRIGRLVTATPWWDTVDQLAVAAGRIVRRNPRSRAVMDEWLASDDPWLVRVAILHQERWLDDTDADWLFAACRRHAADRDFFIRKAIGWALRSEAKCRPETVAGFLRTDGEALSALSRREAQRGVARGRERPAPRRARKADH